MFAIGHPFSIWISNNLTLSFTNGTLSKAPGASNFLYKDFATSRSGEIITSIGILDLFGFGSVANYAHLGGLISGILFAMIYKSFFTMRI